jgi:hypothetical protein
MNIFYPVQWLADWLTYSVFALARGTVLAGAVNFFIISLRIPQFFKTGDE